MKSSNNNHHHKNNNKNNNKKYILFTEIKNKDRNLLKVSQKFLKVLHILIYILK